jgi:uncharacterized protein (TIGR00304 family)
MLFSNLQVSWVIKVDASGFFAVGTLLIIAGIIVVVLAIILLSMGKHGKGKVKGAGVVMIGPIPIIFGTDKKSVMIVVGLAIALMIILIVYYLLAR